MNTLRNGVIWSVMFCGIIVLLLVVTIINQDDIFIKSGISGIAVTSAIISFLDAICSYINYKRLSCENDDTIRDYMEVTQEIDRLKNELIQKGNKPIMELEAYIHATFDASICQHYKDNTLDDNEKSFMLEKATPSMRELLKIIFCSEDDTEMQEIVNFDALDAQKKVYKLQQDYINKKDKQSRILNYFYPLALFIFLFFMLIRQTVSSHIQDILTILAFLGFFINILIQNYIGQKFTQNN